MPSTGTFTRRYRSIVAGVHLVARMSDGRCWREFASQRDRARLHGKRLRGNPPCQVALNMDANTTTLCLIERWLSSPIRGTTVYPKTRQERRMDEEAASQSVSLTREIPMQFGLGFGIISTKNYC